jgi:DNA mismatch repair ATPase MutS
VARLAGLPQEILNRAKDILSHLEKPNGATETREVRRRTRARKPPPKNEKPQLDLL